jgi:hypothetical protein
MATRKTTKQTTKSAAESGASRKKAERREEAQAAASRRDAPGSFFYRNGLTLAFAVLMVLSLVGHALSGTAHGNQVRAEHGLPAQSVTEYVAGPEFQSTLFENWESEFLQMALFVLFTVWLRQRGSSESRKLDPAEEEPDPRVPLAEQPWPMRAGGAWKTLYEHSLSIALGLLFVLTGIAHFFASW